MTFVIHGYVINPSADADGTDLDSMRARMAAVQSNAHTPVGCVDFRSSFVGGDRSEDSRDRDRGTRSHNDQNISRR